MEKIKIATTLVACIILISALVSVSLAKEPITEEAGELEEQSESEPEKEPEAHGTISITGTAFIECAPDLLTIMLKIKGFDSESAEKARDEASIIIDQVLKALKNLGIPDDDIGTTSYNIQPKYEWENNKRVFKGYEVTVTIKITLKDFSKGGKVIDTAVNAGALVDSINFGLTREKRNELKLQAMADAAKDAKLKAETIVTALGDELGDVKSVNLNDYQYQPYIYWTLSDAMSNGMSEKDAVPPTTLMPTDLTVSVNINVVFDIL